MYTTEQDYYELLGVARNADDQEIKKAFRRLARELHPDVSEHPEAALRFRAVSEAYEALSNPETRQLYDRYGHAGLRSGGFTPTHFDLGDLGGLFATFFGNDLFGGREAGRANGADVGAEVQIDLPEAARGVSKTVTARGRRQLRDLRGERRHAGGGRRRLQPLRRRRAPPADLPQRLRRVRSGNNVS